MTIINYLAIVVWLIPCSCAGHTQYHMCVNLQGFNLGTRCKTRMHVYILHSHDVLACMLVDMALHVSSVPFSLPHAGLDHGGSDFYSASYHQG